MRCAWTRLVRREPGTGRGPRLSLIGFLVAAAIGAALWFSVTGPSTRAGAITGALSAVASATAALTALHLSREALARTDQQLANAKRATVLSRYPLLLPVHQSVAFPDSGGSLAAHPPTQERFRLNAPELGAYAFVVDTSDRFVVPVENVGEGPALRMTGSLWCGDRRRGELVGPTALGAGKLAIMTAWLDVAEQELPEPFTTSIRAIGAQMPDCFWLEMSYCDVFSNRLNTSALFDPRGLGGWRQVEIPEIEAGISLPRSR